MERARHLGTGRGGARARRRRRARSAHESFRAGRGSTCAEARRRRRHRPASSRRRARHESGRFVRSDQSCAQRSLGTARECGGELLDDEVDGVDRCRRRDEKDRSGAQRMKRAYIALVALLALGAGTRPTLDRTFANGETLDYTLSWLKIHGGAARMTIGPHEEAGKLRLTSIGKSSASFSHIFNVHDELVSVGAPHNFSTQPFEKHLDERGKGRDETTIVAEPMGIAVRRRAGKN